MNFKYLFVLILLTACTDENQTINTLQKAGFSEIETTGYQMFDCGKDDSFATGFTAKNPQGQVVSGTVCCGLLKSCTIRF